MNTIFDPLVSEFENSDHQEKYNTWLKAKVEKSLADSRPATPHDQAIAKIQAELEKRATARANR